MSTNRNTGDRPQLLYKVTEGTVTAEIHGPRLGWRWREIRYYRWQKATTGKSPWVQVVPSRPTDQIHLERCVKAVRAWLRHEDKSLAEIYRTKP